MLSSSERTELSRNQRPLKKEYNQWKWADVYVDPHMFLNVLQQVKLEH